MLKLADAFDVFRTGVNDLLVRAVVDESNAAIADGRGVTAGAMTSAMEVMGTGMTQVIDARSSLVACEINELLRLLEVEREFASALAESEFDLSDDEHALVADDLAAIGKALPEVCAELDELIAAAKERVEGLSAEAAVRPLRMGLRDALAGSPAIEGYGSSFFLDALPADQMSSATVRVRRLARTARGLSEGREAGR